MKRVLLIGVLLLMSFQVAAQKKKRNAKTTFKVDGVCMMCKKRIEKGALNSKGVKFASWNLETHDLQVIFDERKTSVESIKESVAGVGHDTKEVKAEKEVYDNLHPCCKYRSDEIIIDHKE